MVIRRKKMEKEKIRNKRVKRSGKKADVQFPSDGATKCPYSVSGVPVRLS